MIMCCGGELYWLIDFMLICMWVKLGELFDVDIGVFKGMVMRNV